MGSRKDAEIRKDVADSCDKASRNLVENRFRLAFDLLPCLILNRVCDVDCIQIRSAERARLRPRRGHELRGSDRHRRHAKAFEFC
jgi:hypothetical protein